MYFAYLLTAAYLTAVLNCWVGPVRFRYVVLDHVFMLGVFIFPFVSTKLTNNVSLYKWALLRNLRTLKNIFAILAVLGMPSVIYKFASHVSGGILSFNEHKYVRSFRCSGVDYNIEYINFGVTDDGSVKVSRSVPLFFMLKRSHVVYEAPYYNDVEVTFDRAGFWIRPKGDKRSPPKFVSCQR